MESLWQTTGNLVSEIAENTATTLRRPPSGMRHAPSVKTGRFDGALSHMAENPMPHLERWWRIYGDVFRIRFLMTTGYLISNPDDIKRILQDNHRNYTKGSRGMVMMSMVVGKGLLTSDGDFWLRQRRIAQPAFHRDRITAFIRTMSQYSLDTAEDWYHRGSGEAATVDMSEEMAALTLRIIAKFAFGGDVQGAARETGESVSFLVEETNRRINDLFGAFVQLPNQRNREFHMHMDRLNSVVYRLISDRRKLVSRGSQAPAEDLLGMLLDARDPDTGEGMTDTQLRDEVMTSLLAGHETTANLLCWTFLLLAKHPEVKRRLWDEVDGVPDDFSFESLRSLEFTGRVLSESMRLYPPAWMIERLCVEDDVLGGYPIPAGSTILIPTWLVHRRSDLWDRPLEFDPDRWSDPPNHRYAYFPFSGGPRMCIGRDFALTEAKIILATLAKRFDPQLVGPEPAADPQITLRPKGGLRMQLLKRA